ncbi:N-methylhydantoinase A/acetone carboxylase, beta subunit [Desulfosporosinus orientis DSM 765]|uniref:N-methylhydantoinase A/acetone carboxylase, beta subunit n=1 Tax=Desulfosporosinus orientis (strain ATCC 19365 / DSM 765 / NCIMB 8382 / VKM B-1628 / Singapore I) TaxID=768706 RepID=G7W6X4_DESOD|nr:hydantoinase/oxoprolinase family protein [Desulfosporosinus orientis]AET69831.1 N-methylhydantoinase A/acetone carboxylase, beta subunit [Desulfosporosinus orientis DSM 765]
MDLSLGIDTGGTFTDGVLLDLNTSEVVAKAKAFTTRGNLSIGIQECIENLNWLDMNQIRLVSLSTTLATNTVVEGRGGEVGLILIGHEPIGNLPTQMVVSVTGGHDIKGNPKADLDVDQVQRAALTMKDKVETIAVSGYLSIRNPEHELITQKIIKDLIDVPVVCAHQLTSELGFHDRTVTACLNARLLPVIAELMRAVKKVLDVKNIQAPLMIVKGDGSLMNEKVALTKPIETILSGPAASIVGATFLTGVNNAIVLDMGGTTTDIAILKNGKPMLNREGAVVGGWRTQVEAADIYTYGLGGDSYVQVLPNGNVEIGPRRVSSISSVAARYPYLIEELTRVKPECELATGQPVDCWQLLTVPGENAGLTSDEEKIVETLKQGPHNIFNLAERTGLDPNLMSLKRLEKSQILGRIAFTPTDVLHALGYFTVWNVCAAEMCAQVYSAKLNIPRNDFLLQILKQVQDRICLTILESLIAQEGSRISLIENDTARLFLQPFLSPEFRRGYGVQISLALPIVAIGAPSQAYIPEVGANFKTEVLIPPHAEVANAVGAAVGRVVENVKLVIKPDSEGFLIYAPWGKEQIQFLEEAEIYAIQKAKNVIAEMAYNSGTPDPEIIVEKEEVTVNTFGDKLFLETRILLTAVGRPSFDCYVNISE